VAFIAAPGVAQLRYSGTIGVNTWANVLHWYAGVAAPWTQSQINALSTVAQSAYTTDLAPIFSNDVKLNEVQVVDLSDQTLREATIAGLNVAGTIVGLPPTLAACQMVNLQIGARYRGGHPRIYWPPATVNQTADSDTWTAGAVSNVNAAMNSWTVAITNAMTTAGLAGSSLCAPRYQYQYNDNAAKKRYDKVRVTFKGPFPVTNWLASAQIRTQRRRLGK
jgi:hypothetical protein